MAHNVSPLTAEMIEFYGCSTSAYLPREFLHQFEAEMPPVPEHETSNLFELSEANYPPPSPIDAVSDNGINPDGSRLNFSLNFSLPWTPLGFNATNNESSRLNFDLNYPLSPPEPNVFTSTVVLPPLSLPTLMKVPIYLYHLLYMHHLHSQT